jgi:8-hydroxy-5-deazaflavin:NADPH oxidoreductase
MKIGILGTGEVGQALRRAFKALGHEVKMGGREPNAEKESGTYADAAAFGELILLCTLGSANEAALRAAGLDNLSGKVLIDTTNPLDFSKGMPPGLSVGHTDSAGEQVQRLVPKAKVVKAFNTVGNAHMFKPDFPHGPPDMFICGDDAGAKQQVTSLLQDFGWGVIDIGGISGSRHLEPMCIVWVLHGAKSGSWNHAFKMLRK